MTEVRTRFAPSPTGYMHIGGMRTALFNWLWARHNGGKFILRIDDTDRSRHVEGALQPILEAFRWLGLDWDEGPEVGGPHGPYFQSQRQEIYRQAIERLLASGKAYRCFETPEQIQADRAEDEKAGRPYVSRRRSLDLSAEQVQQWVAEGRPHVIRLLVPRGRTVEIDDAVRGHVSWDTSMMPDPVLVRSDGSPLYNFATVVDDAAMRITHVMRAEEHLSNTPVQCLIYEALGVSPPRFAHIPIVTAPGSSRKLSKRDVAKYRNNPAFRKLFQMAEAVFPVVGLELSESLNPVMVAFYQELGFVPPGVLNALCRLGWSLDDRTEILPLETVVEKFSLERIVKSPAAFDPDKLLMFETHWMQQLPLEERVEGCLRFLAKAGWLPHSPTPRQRDYVTRIVQAMGERLRVFGDILSYGDFFVEDERLEYDEKAFRKRLQSAESIELLAAFRERLGEVEPFTAEELEALMRRFVEQQGVKMGQIVHPVRVAVTGKGVGFGLFETLEILGKDRVLRRIDRALQRARQSLS
ncbi:MAG: glutamate--tRNA ligase [Planctomycetota bacterium]|nr:MAG: glutamate--tRNA ligase [Planctomycetota bacterium]